MCGSAKWPKNIVQTWHKDTRREKTAFNLWTFRSLRTTEKEGSLSLSLSLLILECPPFPPPPPPFPHPSSNKPVCETQILRKEKPVAPERRRSSGRPSLEGREGGREGRRGGYIRAPTSPPGLVRRRKSKKELLSGGKKNLSQESASLIASVRPSRFKIFLSFPEGSTQAFPHK